MRRCITSGCHTKLVIATGAGITPATTIFALTLDCFLDWLRFAGQPNRLSAPLLRSVEKVEARLQTYKITGYTYLHSFLFYSLQVRGHTRAPSDSKEFHEVTKRDALRLLENDVDRLLQTTEPARRPALQAEMGRFADLFGRFLQEGK